MHKANHLCPGGPRPKRPSPRQTAAGARRQRSSQGRARRSWTGQQRPAPPVRTRQGELSAASSALVAGPLASLSEATLAERRLTPPCSSFSRSPLCACRPACCSPAAQRSAVAAAYAHRWGQMLAIARAASASCPSTARWPCMRAPPEGDVLSDARRAPGVVVFPLSHRYRILVDSTDLSRRKKA